jgi:hypothetical protein
VRLAIVVWRIGLRELPSWANALSPSLQFPITGERHAVEAKRRQAISTDVMKQLNSLPSGRPKKGGHFDGDANGLGVVPYGLTGRKPTFHKLRRPAQLFYVSRRF